MGWPWANESKRRGRGDEIATTVNFGCLPTSVHL